MDLFSASAAMAQQNWELENNIVNMDPPSSVSDAVYFYDEAAQAKVQRFSSAQSLCRIQNLFNNPLPAGSRNSSTIPFLNRKYHERKRKFATFKALKRMQASFQNARRLRARYESDPLYHTPHEQEMNEVCTQVEAETSEVCGRLYFALSCVPTSTSSCLACDTKKLGGQLTGSTLPEKARVYRKQFEFKYL